MAGVVTTAELVARLVADTTGFVAGLRAAEGKLLTTTEKMAAMGASASKLGAKLSTSVTLPILAFGALSVRAALQFEESLTKIATLTTATEQDVAAFGKTMLRVSEETGVSLKTLGGAMFMLASSGLSAKTSQEALEMAAQASALGLGDAMTIADAASSAINAYGESNLSARDATNALINAVKMGKMKPEELAASLGKVIPMAASMGITFQEVVANLASLTQIGLNAAVASTSLRGAMTSLLRPTEDARTALLDAGFSAEKVRRSVKENGLLPTLQALSDHFHGNTAAIATLFPEVRGLIGVLAWTGSNAKNSATNFDELRRNTDMLAKGMKYLAEQPGFQMKRAFTEIQVSLAKAGDAILPVASKMTQGFASIVKAVLSLPKPVLEVLAALAATIATIGPALWVFGKLVSTFTALRGAVMALNESFTISALTTGNWVALAALAVGVFVGVISMLGGGAEKATGALDAMTESLKRQKGVLDASAVASIQAELEEKGHLRTLRDIGAYLPYGVNALALYVQALQGSKDAQRALRQAAVDSGAAVIQYGGKIDNNRKDLERWIETGKEFRKGQAYVKQTYVDESELLRFLTAQQGEYASATEAAAAAQQVGAAAFTDMKGAVANADTALGSVETTTESLKASMDLTKQAADAMRTAFDYLFGTGTDLVTAELDAQDSIDAVRKSFEDGTATTRDHVRALLAAKVGFQNLAIAQQSATGDTKAAENAMLMNIVSLFQTAKQANATTDEIDRLARAYELPDAVRTAIETPGADVATILIEALQGKLKVLDETTASPTITPQVNLGPWNAALASFERQMVAAGGDLATLALLGGAGGPLDTPQTPPHAAGGVFTKRHLGIIGEAGPEAIVPLGSSPSADTNRANVLASLGIGSAGTPSQMSASTTIENRYEITVNVPPTADAARVGQSIVDALSAWSRRNGALPVRAQS